jgi:hypothetical protein
MNILATLPTVGVEDINYNIIKSLGYSPNDVINHNDLRKPYIE